MNFNKQKFIIATVCSLLGWGVGYEMGKENARREFAQQQRIQGFPWSFGGSLLGPMFDQEGPEDTSPPSLWRRFFADSDKTQPEQDDGGIFDNPFSMFGQRFSQPEVNLREDESNVYMEIDLESFDKNSLSARVENGNVIVEGNQKSEEGGSSMSSHFYQSFPAPEGTDPTKVDMTHENHKLVLKFPKIK